MTTIISEIDITKAQKLEKVDYIDRDFVIFDDISQVPLTHHPSRMNAMVIAICLKGSLKLGINLQEYQIIQNSLLQ